MSSSLAVLGAAEPLVDPSLDLFDEIERLRKERNAVILAHYYQDGEIQDLADFLGDSLQLSRAAAETDADVIVFCGVHFMAETAKILNPEKVVVLPDLDAGCSLSDSCPAPALERFKTLHPDHKVVSYINCSAGVKALSDMICTSSNAEKVIASFPEGTPILFAPDRNLGSWLQKQSGREMLLWQGTCVVHETFSERKLVRLRHDHPDARIIAHPECEETILRHADHVGSTSSLLQYTQENPAQEFIVATEAGILHQMQKASPDKTFIPLPPEAGCACNNCPYMKLNTLEKLYLCLRDLEPRIELDEELRLKALAPIEKMLSLS
jgi:quinolinate synthase